MSMVNAYKIISNHRVNYYRDSILHRDFLPVLCHFLVISTFSKNKRTPSIRRINESISLSNSLTC